MQSGSADFHGARDHFALGMKGRALRNWLLARRDELLPLQQRLGLRHVGACFDLRAARRFLDRDNLIESVEVAHIQFAKTGYEVGDGAISIGGRGWGFSDNVHDLILTRWMKWTIPLCSFHFRAFASICARSL